MTAHVAQLWVADSHTCCGATAVVELIKSSRVSKPYSANFDSDPLEPLLKGYNYLLRSAPRDGSNTSQANHKTVLLHSGYPSTKAVGNSIILN